MEPPERGLAITGANGQLGRALLKELAKRGNGKVRALVRSERARDSIRALGIEPEPEILIVDYASPREMEAALAGMRCVIHLVGIIKETKEARYVEAHEQTCHVLSLAASRSGVERIVYLSILGAYNESDNDCLASKARAESILLSERVPATILRVPMVLGGDDPATDSLRRQARAEKLRLVAGGRTRQQPIDSRDVVRAVLAACDAEPGRDLTLNAGGPESLTHRDLVLRAARLWNNQPVIRSIPSGLARFAVAVAAFILPNPPITPAMFDILQHDDQTDPRVLTSTLGIELTPLSKTLSDHVGPGDSNTTSENES